MLFELLYDHAIYHVNALRTHEWGVRALEKIGKSPRAKGFVQRVWGYTDPILETEVFGQKLRSRVGIAGGLVKTGTAADGLADFGGVGWVEVGTLTYDPYGGNPDKFIERYPGGVLNFMGFPNLGILEGVESIENRTNKDVAVSVNIGITPGTDNIRTAENDLAAMMYILSRDLGPQILCVVFNPYCLNVHGVGFREQDRIVHGVRAVNAGRRRAVEDSLPRLNLLVKLGPDLSREETKRVVEMSVFGGADGFIATNTTGSREGLPRHLIGRKGGVSGSRLKDKATEVVRWVHEFAPEKLLVGVGGIASYKDAQEKFQAGAHLVQVYTGFVRKPGLIKEINRGLATEARRILMDNMEQRPIEINLRNRRKAEVSVDV